MKRKVRLNTILTAVLIIGIIASVIAIGGKVKIEQDCLTYDIVMDYQSLCDMVRQSDKDMDYWLDFFSKQNINKIAFPEYSLNSFAEEFPERCSVKTVDVIKADIYWERTNPKTIRELISNSDDKADVLAIFKSKKDMLWFENAFEARTENGKLTTYTDDDFGYIWIEKDNNKVKGSAYADLPLGIVTDMEEKLQSYGYSIVPQMAPVKQLNGEKYMNAVLQQVNRYESPYFIPMGTSIPGAENENFAQSFTEGLKQSDTVFCVLETMQEAKNIDFAGGAEVVAKLNCEVVRTFTMWSYIQNRYQVYGYEDAEEVANCMYRAAYERNCRLIYMKMIKPSGQNTKYIVNSDDYVKLLSDFHQKMQKNGFTYETLQPNRAYKPSVILRLFIGMGAVAACVFLLRLFVTIGDRTAIAVLTFGCVLMAAVTLLMPEMSKLFLSIGGGIVMPSLAAVGINKALKSSAIYNKPCKKSVQFIGKTAITVCGLFILSFVGALFAAAPISETSYVVEESLYRGVKVMQLVPLAVYIVSYIQLYFWDDIAGTLRNKPQIRKIFTKEARNAFMSKIVSVKTICRVLLGIGFAVLLLLMGRYYLIRTGNITPSISIAEIKFRIFLEERLIARPRSKEFLFGYPCIMLMLWCAEKKLKYLQGLFGAGAVIGAYVSVPNTFLHIRSRFIMNVIRELTGLAFGLVIGFVAVIIVECIYRTVVKRVSVKKLESRSEI